MCVCVCVCVCVRSGTSEASPMVAGAAALLASQPGFRSNPALIRQTLINDGNQNYVHQEDGGGSVTAPLLDVSNPADFTAETVPAAVMPRASVTDAYVSEPPVGQTGSATFTISLSAPPPDGETVWLHVATANGTAKSGTDYTALPSSTIVSFGPGQTTQTVTVPIKGDNFPLGSTTFALNLSAGMGVSISDSSATATLVDGPSAPVPQAFSVSDATAVVPSSGTGSATFTVSLPNPVASGVTTSVKVATADGTAHAGVDYTSVSQTLTFPAGTQSETVTVPVLAAAAQSADKTFSLKLSGAVGASLADISATGTLVNPAGPLQLSVSDAWGSGGSSQSFVVSLNAPPAPGQTVSVKVATANGTAHAGVDYTSVPSTTLSFAPGQTSRTVSVPVNHNTTTKNKTYSLKLSSPVAAVVVDSAGTGTITPDSAPAAAPLTASIADLWTIEAAAGSSAVQQATVSLSAPVPAGQTVSLSVATADGTAQAGTDYVAIPKTTLTFTAGQQSQPVSVTTTGTPTPYTAKTFTLNLSGPSSGLAIADAQATVTLNDPQGPLQMSIGNAWVNDAPTGATENFVVALSSPAVSPVSATVTTANGTAVSGLDFDPPASTVSFAPGDSTDTVSVPVNGGDLGITTFTVTLASPTGAVLIDSQGVGTIAGDQAPLQISVSDPAVTKSDSATTPMTYTLSLSAPVPSGRTVTVTTATTAGGTAKSGTDFAPLPATPVTFTAGQSSANAVVQVLGDVTPEPNLTVLLALSGASGATIVDAAGVGTIMSND